MNCVQHGEARLTLVFVFPHVDHYCGIVSYRRDGKHVRNAKVSVVVTLPPAEEKKRTMIVSVGGVAPVGTFSAGWFDVRTRPDPVDPQADRNRFSPSDSCGTDNATNEDPCDHLYSPSSSPHTERRPWVFRRREKERRATVLLNRHQRKGQNGAPSLI